ncbi:comEA protein [compost metagenome]
MNYRSKGGRFYTVTDLKRMYVISPSTYKRLAPYIRLKQQPDAPRQAAIREPGKKELYLVNINLADTVELDRLKGIGPAFARRIVKYRERLGGFYNKEQLLEVYGMDSLKYTAMKMQLLIDTSAIRKIPLNTVSAEVLTKHPYLTYKLANALIRYREQHGNYRDMADLKKVLILDAKTIERLSPYLAF